MSVNNYSPKQWGSPHIFGSSLDSTKRVVLVPQKNGYNQLTYLIAEKFDKERIAELIETCDDIRKLDRKGRAPIHWASLFLYGSMEQDFLEICHKLLKSGAGANDLDRDGNTPLHIMMSSVESYCLAKSVVDMMLNSGADPFIINHEGNTAIDEILSNWKLSNEDKLKLIDRILNRYPKAKRNEEIGKTTCKLLKEGFHDAKPLLSSLSSWIEFSQVRDADGTPPLNRVILNPYYDDKELLEAVEFLLTHGADPNAASKDGRTPLHALNERKHLSFSTRKKIMLLLKNHAADVTIKTVTGEGHFLKIILTLSESHSDKEITEYLTLFYGTNLFLEFYYRELLVNSFAIDEYKSELGSEMVSFTGTFSLKKISDLLTEHSFSFYSELASMIHCREESPLWHQVLDHCSQETREYLNTVSEKDLVKLEEVLRKIPDLQKVSSRVQDMPVKKILDAISGEQPLPIIATHRDPSHAVGYFSLGNHILVCNKGYASGRSPGISVHRKSSVGDLEKMASDLKNEINLGKFLLTHFPERTIEDSFFERSSTVYFIGQKPQKAGNCPVASYNSLELAMLFSLMRTIINNDAVAENLCRAIKSTHSALRREAILEKYLEMHKNPTSVKALVDIQLLITLALQETSHPGLDKTRLERVSKWLKENDEEGFQVLMTRMAEREEDFLSFGFGYTQIPKTPTCDYVESEYDYESPGTPVGIYYKDDDFPEVPLTPGRDHYEQGENSYVPLTPGRDLYESDEYADAPSTPGCDFFDKEDYPPTPPTPGEYHAFHEFTLFDEISTAPDAVESIEKIKPEKSRKRDHVEMNQSSSKDKKSVSHKKARTDKT